MKHFSRSALIILLTCFFLSFALPLHAARVEIILDASGSMAALLPDGQPKIEAAKTAVRELLAAIDPVTTIAFRAYGHQSDKAKKDCTDSRLLVPFGETAEVSAAIITSLGPLSPRGYTPISYVLQQAAADFGGPGEESRTIVLVSDGKETCEGDPCAVAMALAAADVKAIIHVIGFDVDVSTRQQLQCVAKAGGGQYFDVRDAASLAKALKDAVQPLESPQQLRVLKLPDTRPGVIKIEGADITGHKITEAVGGKEVANLSHVQGSAEVPAGLYNVTVGAGTLKSVEVLPGEITLIRPGHIEVKGASISGHRILDPETEEEMAVVSATGNSAAVMPGRYVVSFGRLFWPVEVGEGEKVVLNPGRVSGKGLDINGLVIYSAAGGEAGRISATSSTLPLPPGDYEVEKAGRRIPFALKEGDLLELQ
ncbi:MAG: VWA domain-containing protein [Desulfoprunum sp.]|nr:VWA domain-containing protein [Desulfoprunum sp.]